jgi:hypothetical protein
MSANAPWIIGALAAILFFAYFESKALKNGARINTLSRAIYTLGVNWPLSIFLMGMFCGGLAVHFYWHFCPAGSVTEGLLEMSPKAQTEMFGRYLEWSK